MQQNQSLVDFYSNEAKDSGAPLETVKAWGLDNLSPSGKPKATARQGYSTDVSAIIAQEGADHLKPIIAAIYGQESGSGANARTSIDGARGGMQIIPDTFRRFAKPGERIDNPDDNMRVGVRILKTMADKYGNDPAKIATAYFSGEGNVNSGQGNAWKQDHKDGNGKSVSGYVSDILAKVGGMGEAQGAGTTKAPGQPGLPDLSKAPKWKDIIRKPEFTSLPPETQAEAKAAYFDYYIAPHTGQQAATLRQQFMAMQAKAAPERTWGEAAKDTGVQLLEGAVNIVKAPVDLAAPESGLAKSLQGAGDYLRDKQSDPMKAKIAEADAAIKKAAESGEVEAFKTAIATYASDPALLARFSVTNLASLVPGLGAAKAAQLAAVARGASAANASRVALGAASATNAVLNAGGARGDAFDDIKKTLIQQGVSPEQAEQQAIEQSRLSAAVGGAAGALSGRIGLEGALFKNAAGGLTAKAAAGKAAANIVSENVGELAEELLPKIATNATLSDVGGRSLVHGVGETAAQTLAGAGPLSAVGGAKTYRDARAPTAQGVTADGRLDTSGQTATEPTSQDRQIDSALNEAKQRQLADAAGDDREIELWTKASDGTLTPEERAELTSLQQGQLAAPMQENAPEQAAPEAPVAIAQPEPAAPVIESAPPRPKHPTEQAADAVVAAPAQEVGISIETVLPTRAAVKQATPLTGASAPPPVDLPAPQPGAESGALPMDTLAQTGEIPSIEAPDVEIPTPPRTEKEARARRAQQQESSNAPQTNEAQQAEAQRPEWQQASPPADAFVAPKNEREAQEQRRKADSLTPGNQVASESPSWVLRNKETGEAVMETSDPKKVAALNTAKYEAVPIRQYLEELNRSTKANDAQNLPQQPGASLQGAAGGQESAPVASGAAAPAAKAKQKAGPRNRQDLIGAILRVTGGKGIAASNALDVAGDTANNLTKVRGLFTHEGTSDLGQLANYLNTEEGYSFPDGESLRLAIRDATFGDVAKNDADAVADLETQEQARYKDHILQEAKRLGLKGIGGKRTLAVVVADIARVTAEAEKVEAERNAMEAQEERAAIQAEAVVEATEGSELTDADLKRWLGTVINYTQDDIDEANTRASERESRRAEAYSYDDTEGQTQGGSGERDQDGAPQARTGRPEQREGGTAEEGLTLTQQTNTQAAAEFARQQEEANKKNEAPKSPNVYADQGDLFNTQGALFNSNRDKPADQPRADSVTAPEKSEAGAKPETVTVNAENEAESGVRYSKTSKTVDSLRNSPILSAESITDANAPIGFSLRVARPYYESLMASPVYAPAFGESVSFTEKGWKYITDEAFASSQNNDQAKKNRSAEEVSMRLSLLPKAKSIIENAQSIEEVRNVDNNVIRYSLVGRFNDGDVVRVIVEETNRDGKIFLSLFDLERVAKQLSRDSLPTTARDSSSSVQGKATGEESASDSNIRNSDDIRKFSKANAGVQSANDLRNQPSNNRALDRDELTRLRRVASGMDRAEDGITLLVTEDGRAIATGPRGVKVPPRYLRFAEENNLAFEARRLPIGSGTKGSPIPVRYRESGALYFGEMQADMLPNDRTGLSRFSKASAESWYFSQLAKQVESAPDRMFSTAPQFKLWLSSNAAKLGIKKDEIQWSGINEYLDTLGKGKISKQDVLTYLEGNGVQIQEVVKGDDAEAKQRAKLDLINDLYDTLLNGRSIAELSDAERKEISRLTQEHDAIADEPVWNEETKYADYQLPGGENYKELLLTLPTVGLKHGLENVYIDREETEQRGKADTDLFWFVRGPDNLYQIPKRNHPTEQAAVDYVINEKKPSPDSRNYTSSHWDEKNILAHVRFNERVDSDGAKVLFIEELQSDWSSDGRKKGFGPIRPMTEAEKSEWRILEKTSARERTSDQNDRLEYLDNLMAGNGDKNPAGPFVQETKDYLTLAMKRMMRYAADNGFQKIAWINGQQAHERFPEGHDGQSTEKGMKTSYDVMMPSVAADLLKKMGGKMEMVSITQLKGKPTQYADFSAWKNAPDSATLEQPGFTVPAAAASPMPLFTKSESTGSMPQTEAESLINKALGTNLGEALVDSGIITFSHDGDKYQGATYRDGSIALNLDSLTSDNFAGVLLHEGFHSTIKNLLGEETYAKLMNELSTGVKLGKGAQWLKDAEAAIPSDTKAADVAEEIGAYAIEQHLAGTLKPGFLKRWVEKLLSALRTAIIQHMPNERMKAWAIKNITPMDLANLAIFGLKAKARGQLQQGREAMAYSVKRESLLDMAPVKIAFNTDGTFPEAKLRAKTSYATLQNETQKNGFAATTIDGHPVKFSGAGFKEVTQHAADRRVLAILANAKKLIESAKPLYSESPSEKEQGVRMYHYYGVKTEINGDQAFALLEIKETTNGDWFYDADATDVETARAVYSAALADQTKSGAGVTEAKSLNGRLSKCLSGVILYNFFRNSKSAAEDIRYSKASNQSPLSLTGGKPASPQPALPSESPLRYAQRRVQDKLNRFTVIKDWLAEQGVKLSEIADVYKAEERMHSRFANKAEDFRKKRVGPLIKKIADAGFTMDEVAQLLHAQHAQERNAQVAKVNQNQPDGGSGMTNAEAKAVLAKASPELAKLANEFRAIADDTLAILVNSGMVSKERAKTYRAAYQHYVPLKGGPDDGSQTGTGKGLSVRHKIKRALGHEMREGGEWIVENVIADHERALMLAEKNRVGVHLLNMAIEVGRDDLLTIDKPKKRQVLKENVAYEVLHQGQVIGTLNSQEAAQLFKANAQNMTKSSTPSHFTIRRTSDPAVILMASPMIADNETIVYVHGYEIRMQINDELLARAYKNMGTEAMNAVIRVGAGLNAFFSRIYTGYNPEFIVTNIVRDFTSGLANLTGEQGAAMAASAAKNYAARFCELFKYAYTGQETKWVKMYREDGGNTGAAYLTDLERLGTDIQTEYAAYAGVMANLKASDYKNAARAAGRKAFEKTIVWIERLNQAGENAMRLAAYQAMVESGATRNEAASAAKNVTVNFNRKGELGQTLNATWLFFNAGVQGTAAIAHAHDKGKHRLQAWAFSSAMMGLGYLASLAAAGDDDDEYEKISDYERSRNLLIKTTDGYAKLPLPYGYGFFWNMGRGMADAQRTGELGKMPWHVAASFVGEFTPFGATVAGKEGTLAQGLHGAMPTIYQIVAAPINNRSSFGTPLIPENPYDKHQPDREKMNRATRGTLADMVAGALDAAGLDVSPETLNHLGRTFTGGAGVFAASLGNIGKLSLVDGVSDFETKEIPFARKFYTVPDVRGARSRYFEAKEEASKATLALNRARKAADEAKVRQIYETQQEMLFMAKLADKRSNMIKAQRDRADAVRLSGKYTKAEERAIIKQMEREEATMYDDFMATFKPAKKTMQEKAEKREAMAQ